MDWEKAAKGLRHIWITCVAVAVGFMLLGFLLFLILTSKPNPRRLAKSAASLIPYISEIRPFVEENWERMDEVRLIKRKHSETEEPLTEEEEAILASFFTEDCPFTYMDQDRGFFTNFESRVGSSRLYVMYLPDDEWNKDPPWWIDCIYYMEELVPEWYACTEPQWNASNSPISFDHLRAEREDRGRVFLPREGIDLRTVG